jgi:ammonium transporter, Amt family
MTYKKVDRHLIYLTFLIILFCCLPNICHAAAPVAITNSGHATWIIVSTILVLFMSIPGLILFYGGLVREKNVLSITSVGFIIAGLCSILWILIGYRLCFSIDAWMLTDLIGGQSNALLANLSTQKIDQFLFIGYQMGFAIITPILILGGFPERTKFLSTIVFLFVWEILVYYPVCYWVWGGGWLQKLGLLDFAGGTVVHINAGISGLVGAIVIGKRRGFQVHEFKPHNIMMVVTGASILWFGWFGFNAGAAHNLPIAMRIIINTYIAASASAIAWMLAEWLVYKKPSALGIIFGNITGLVAITPACAFVGFFGAIAIGFIAGFICMFLCSLKYKLGYDDSLDAFGVHGAGGIIGCLLTGIFAATSMGGHVENLNILKQFSIQLLSTVIVIIYAFVVSYILLKIIDKLMGLRVSKHEETMGIDISFHGQKGYHSAKDLD